MAKLKIFFVVMAVVAGFFALRQVFSGAWILPQVWQVGPVTLRYYGMILGLAIIAAYFLAAQRAPRYGLGLSQLDTALWWLILGGFVGARLYHVISEFAYYQDHLGQIIMVWQGGLSIFGALIGGVVGLVIARRKLAEQSLLKLLDWLAPSLLLGQIIGRFGNLFNYELYGYPTNLPWKMFVPQQFRLPQFPGTEFFHPLFLYEALLNTIFLLLLLKTISPKSRSGTLFFTYLFLYNAGRFFLEFMRPDSVLWGSVRVNGVISLVLAGIGLCGFLYLNYASTQPSSN